jgi:uncharacterized membrane protein YagU involved in acid resistance
MNKSLQVGVIGGIIGGIIFGVLMQMMGMIPMISMMVGSESLAVGWIMHMIISVIFAAGFVVLAKFIKNLILLTIVYGVLIWIVGPLLIMPMMLGMGPMIANAFAPDQLMSLMTHIFFSVILAIVYKVINGKTVNNHISA